MKIGNYETHPAADEVPMLTATELAGLTEDIKANGLRVAIVLFEGRILDGRNRLLACLAAGVAPRFEQHDGSDPYLFVLSLNLKRRQMEDAILRVLVSKKLIEGSDAYVAAQAKAKEEANRARGEKAKGNQNAAKKAPAAAAAKNSPASREAAPSPRPAPASPARDHAAEAARKAATRLAAAAGTSRATVERAMELERKAPDLVERMKSEAKAGEPQRLTGNKALAQIKTAETQAKVAAQAAQAPERATIRQQDAISFLKALPGAGADLLLTDPPYSTDVEDIATFAVEWAPLAISRLKATGRAFICIGAYPRELHAYLSALASPPGGFTLAQVLVWTYRNTIGPSPTLDYKLNWQAILYLRGPKAPALDSPLMVEQFSVQDINAPDGRQGDRYHAWQKPDALAERFVRHASKAGDLVIDPFAGTGTFLLAAARLGRRAIGSDIGGDAFEASAGRGCLHAA
jgi:hypothetical protein